MRLIDADDCEKYFYEHLDDAHMIAALNAISEMPTVEKGAREMDDLIRRQDVLDAIEYELDTIDHVPVWVFDRLRRVIKGIPTVDAVPVKRGKWNVDGVGLTATRYKCSECGRVVFDKNGYDVAKDYPFCPCGAKMERWC